MMKSRKREYWIVQLLFAVFLLMPIAALAQESNTQSVRDPDILHDVALSFVTSTDGFSADLERAWRGRALCASDPRSPFITRGALLSSGECGSVPDGTGSWAKLKAFSCPHLNPEVTSPAFRLQNGRSYHVY